MFSPWMSGEYLMYSYQYSGCKLVPVFTSLKKEEDCEDGEKTTTNQQKEKAITNQPTKPKTQKGISKWKNPTTTQTPEQMPMR